MDDEDAKLIKTALHSQTLAMVLGRENAQLKALVEALKMQIKAQHNSIAEYDKWIARLQCELEELKNKEFGEDTKIT
jgi:hypothetical protein